MPRRPWPERDAVWTCLLAALSAAASNCLDSSGGSRRGASCSWPGNSQAKGFAHEPAEKRVDVRPLGDKRLGIALAIEILVDQLAADVQGVKHGAETIQIGARVGLIGRTDQLGRGVKAGANGSLGRYGN